MRSNKITGRLPPNAKRVLLPNIGCWEAEKSLMRSALESTRRKAGPFQSAMSMLNFYINRAGRNLGPKQKKVLEEAKEELRKLKNKSCL